jgi:hypothetical protein
MRIWTLICLLIMLVTQVPGQASAKAIVLVCTMRLDLRPNDLENTLLLRVDSAHRLVALGSRPYQHATFGDVTITWSGAAGTYVLGRPDLRLNIYGYAPQFSSFGHCHQSKNQI